MDAPRTILLIEDDKSIRHVVESQLRLDGFEVDFAITGEEGLTKALGGEHVLIILDINLPQMNGIDICSRIRASNQSVPIIMLTSRDSEIDRIIGLEIGADDYIVKPFNLRELSARVRARLRQRFPAGKVEHSADEHLISFGPLTIDRLKRTVQINGKALSLTVKEFDVLALLAGNPGCVFSRSELLEKVWGISSTRYDDSVTQMMVRLRKKLESIHEFPELIKTVTGVGYRFVELFELQVSPGVQSSDKAIKN